MDEKSDGSAPVDIKKADGPPRLLTLVHEAIRRKYYSRRTEEAYVHWIKRVIYFHGKRHPRDMGEAEVTAFLNDLASVRNVAGGTQNQALSALLFLYKEVLGKDLAWLDGLVRAKRAAAPAHGADAGGSGSAARATDRRAMAAGEPAVRCGACTRGT